MSVTPKKNPKKQTQNLKRVKPALNQQDKKFFWTELKAELIKVSWPGKSMVIKASFLVIVIMILSTTFVAIADMAFSKLFVSL